MTLADDERRRLTATIARLERKLARAEENLQQIDGVRWAYERLSTRLMDDLRARGRALEEDLQQAAALVRALQAATPRVPWARVATRDLPATTVGGDLYEVLVTPDGALRVFLADATGHGMQGALRAMMLRAVLARHGATAEAPAALLAAIDHDLAALGWAHEARVAACCFDLRPADGGTLVGRYANAGMPPLIVLSQRWDERYVAGPFLGMTASFRAPEVTLEIAPGARVVAHSDGLLEQWNPRREFVSEPALWTHVLAAGDVDGTADAALAFVEVHRAGEAQPDDVTLIALARYSA